MYLGIYVPCALVSYILHVPIIEFSVCDIDRISSTTVSICLALEQPKISFYQRQDDNPIEMLNTQTYHVHLQLIDPPIVFKTNEKPVSLLLLLLMGLQQSHGHLKPL